MATSASDLLDEVNTAIVSCMKSQMSSNRGLSLQRARLAELQALRRELIAEVKEAGGGMASVGQVDRAR